MSSFLSLLVIGPEKGVSGGLRTNTDFYLTEIATEYSINDWINDFNTSKDELRFFLSIATKLPYFSSTVQEFTADKDTLDVLYVGESSEAFIAAHVLQYPLISFCHSQWDSSLFECELQEITETSDISTKGCDLVNIARIEHYDEHRQWIQSRIRQSIKSVGYLWSNRESLMPNLIFSPSVEQNLVSESMRGVRFKQILNKLWELETYFESWQSGHFDRAQFSHCNPVSKKTFQAYPEAYTFSGPDGNEITADWHLYFTPGAGRLYFCPMGETRKGIICYIGDKLPDVTY